jgi:hypothetical protein
MAVAMKEERLGVGELDSDLNGSGDRASAECARSPLFTNRCGRPDGPFARQLPALQLRPSNVPEAHGGQERYARRAPRSRGSRMIHLLLGFPTYRTSTRSLRMYKTARTLTPASGREYSRTQHRECGEGDLAPNDPPPTGHEQPGTVGSARTVPDRPRIPR